MRQAILQRLARLEHMAPSRLIVLFPADEYGDGSNGYRELGTGRMYPPGFDPIGDNLITLRVVYKEAHDNKSTHE